MGARILVIRDNKVLLVKHTYQRGWYTVGGGVEPGETPLQAVHRELAEEVGVTLKTEPTLFNVYYSDYQKRDDYIVFYIGHNPIQEKVRCLEIADQQWFDLDNLPEDATPATKRRIEEYLKRRPLSDHW